MTDIKKIIEEQINQAWARGTNWAMQGRGYALDTNADTKADVLIELFKNIQEEAVAEERDRVRGEIKGKKKYWHLQFEGCSDYAESVRRKKYNEEVTNYINGVLDDLLSLLEKPLTKKD